MASKLVPLELPDGQQIWFEVEMAPTETEWGPQQISVIEQVGGRLVCEAIDNTIQSFSRIVLQSVVKLAGEEPAPEKVSVEFGVKLVGEAAVPTIAKGTAEANLGVTIEWTLKAEERQ